MVTLRGLRADPLWERLTEFPVCATWTGLAETGICDSRKADCESRRDSPTWTGNGEAPLVVQINVLPGAVVEAVRSVLEIDPRASVLAHAGGGVIYARLHLKPGEAAVVLDERLRPALARGGGGLVILRQPEGAKFERQAVWGPPRPAHAVMQAIKDQFDPQGILNRGRFVFAPKVR
jgi:FAD/FMN-containing dehydrogenase